MISLFDTAKRILKSFFDDNLFSINNILSKTATLALVRAIDKGIKKDYDKVLKSVNKEVRSKLKNEYNQFIKKGIFQTASGIQKYKIEDLKPDFKKELERRINVSLSYITTQDQNTIEEIKNRFYNKKEALYYRASLLYIISISLLSLWQNKANHQDILK